MKEAFYLRHDYNSRNDERILKLRRKYPNASGYGIYWLLIEKLAESSEGRLKLEDIEDIAFELHLQCECITDVIHNYGLFKIDDTYFWSNRLLSDLKERDIKSKKASLASKIRWQKEAEKMQTHTECNADAMQGEERRGQESKGKESKEEDIIISKDIQTESETIRNDDLVDVEIVKEKSSAKKESYGNEEINKMLNTIKQALGLSDFKESVKMQRNFGKHLVNLRNKLGREEFTERFVALAHDDFHLKNMGSLKYTYNQIKGFVPVTKEIQSFN
jgi:hypothetical protein